jgi:hypothetical protein
VERSGIEGPRAIGTRRVVRQGVARQYLGDARVDRNEQGVARIGGPAAELVPTARW